MGENGNDGVERSEEMRTGNMTVPHLRSAQGGGGLRRAEDTRTTPELIAVPAAKCLTYLLFRMQSKKKKKKPRDYNAITYWLEILSGIAKTQSLWFRLQLITAIKENKNHNAIFSDRVRQLCFVFVIHSYFEDSQHLRDQTGVKGYKPHC